MIRESIRVLFGLNSRSSCSIQWLKMSRHVQHKSKKTPANRFAALLFAVWVSLAVQPCAIAAVSDHDCPHCPTEVESGAVHGAHGSQKSHDHGSMGSSEAAVSEMCASMQSDCCDNDESAVSARAVSPDLDANPVALPTCGPTWVDRPDPRQEPAKATGPPVLPGGLISLQDLYCVYLK